MGRSTRKLKTKYPSDTSQEVPHKTSSGAFCFIVGASRDAHTQSKQPQNKRAAKKTTSQNDTGTRLKVQDDITHQTK